MVESAPAPAKKSNRSNIIIVVVVVIVLLACCACIGVSFLYFCGDMMTGAGGCSF